MREVVPLILLVNNLNNMKKKLYIGCSLTLLPPNKKDAFLEMVSLIKKELSKKYNLNLISLYPEDLYPEWKVDWKLPFFVL